MTGKHTPGPWEAYVGVVRTVPVVNDRGGMSGGYLIAETSLDDVARYANARLIAAAPDMLEALENTTAALRSIIPLTVMLPADRDAHRKTLTEAEAVLAKVHGKTR